MEAGEVKMRHLSTEADPQAVGEPWHFGAWSKSIASTMGIILADASGPNSHMGDCGLVTVT
jgi:hypothetical protein